MQTERIKPDSGMAGAAYATTRPPWRLWISGLRRETRPAALSRGTNLTSNLRATYSTSDFPVPTAYGTYDARILLAAVSERMSFEPSSIIDARASRKSISTSISFVRP